MKPPNAALPRLPLWFPLLIIGAGALAYASSFGGGFVFDDQIAIENNPHLRSLWPTWPQMWAPSNNPLTGRPVAAFTLAVNYTISGLKTGSYHLFNVAIHLLAGLTLLGILRRTLHTQTAADRFGGSAEWLALAVTLLWIVHPLGTESVTYISIRTESLMGLCFLLTLYCAIRGAEAPTGRRWYVAAVVACALGVGSKEIAGVAPLVVLLHDRTFLAGTFGGALRRRAGLYAGLASTWILLALLVISGPRSGSVGFDMPSIRPWEYALTQCGVILHYLRLSLWPHPLVLCYDGWPVARSLGAAWPSALAILALLSGTLWALWRKPRLGFLGAWFFLILAPTSSIVPITTEVAAERRMYLPLIAVVVLVSLALAAALRGVVRRRRAAVVLVIVAVVAGILLTTRRNLDYRDEAGIWRAVLRYYPNSRLAHLSLAYRFVRLHQLPEAAAEYAQAVALNPNAPRVRLNYGGVLALLGRSAEARRELEKSLELAPQQPFAHFQLGRICEAEGKLTEAAEHYLAGLRMNPNDATAHSRLGIVLASLGRTDEARAHLAAALRLQPGLEEARATLASLEAPASSDQHP